MKSTKIEILVPARVIFPPGYKTIAVRYNNCNVAYNPQFANYYINDKAFSDTTNIDSAAAEVYYKSFLNTINSNFFFDSIVEVQKAQYSQFLFSDSLIRQAQNPAADNLDAMLPAAVSYFLPYATRMQPVTPQKKIVKQIDPEFGLYTRAELAAIADTTGADMLLSLDFFTTLDAQTKTGSLYTDRQVLIVTYWNFYDLNHQTLPYFSNRADTIAWTLMGETLLTPPRKEALLGAAEISGNEFAEFLVPHWTEVERVYFPAWKKELKITNRLLSEGKWLDAAACWRPCTNDNNKRTVAKSMFNMALACEMENRLDAAIDWAVRSYHVFGQKNNFHQQMCQDYINLLILRKQDIKYLDLQLPPDTPLDE